MWLLISLLLPVFGFIYMIVDGFKNPYQLIGVGEFVFLITIILSFGILVGRYL